MKSEPDVFSIDDLKTKKKTSWDGVRNYQARNFMRDEMQIGDEVLFYHSNCNPPGVAGIAKVVKLAYPDHTALDKNSEYFDPKATKDNLRWMMVDVGYVKKFTHFVSLEEMKGMSALKEMKVLQKGNRLSITPVSKKEFEAIQKLGLS